jgi:hypothetical protein
MCFYKKPGGWNTPFFTGDLVWKGPAPVKHEKKDRGGLETPGTTGQTVSLHS